MAVVVIIATVIDTITIKQDQLVIATTFNTFNNKIAIIDQTGRIIIIVLYSPADRPQELPSRLLLVRFLSIFIFVTSIEITQHFPSSLRKTLLVCISPHVDFYHSYRVSIHMPIVLCTHLRISFKTSYY